MPFKSEKQRRYLWANEPDIARDWTDNYGSRIQKNDGGITRIPFKKGGWSPGAGRDSSGYQSSHTKSSSNERRQPGHSHSNERRHTPKPPPQEDKREKYIATRPPVTTTPKDGGTWKEKEKRDLDKAKQIAKIKNIKPVGTLAQRGLFNLIPNDPNLAYQFLKNLSEDEQELFDSLPEELKGLVGVAKPGGEHPEIDFDKWSMLSQVPGYGKYLSDRGKPGVLHGGDLKNVGERFVKYTIDEDGNKVKQKDKYGNVLYGYHEPTGDNEGQMREFQRSGYPSFDAWLASQNQGGGGGGVTTPATPTTTTSPFQQSLNTGIAQGASPYYVGANPTAANLAWGQQFNVDPRTMYRTTWADGGPIRQRYFLGKIVKKIGRAAKKVIKSPLGKAALIGLGGYWLGGGQALGGSKMFGTKFGKNFALKNLMQRKGIQSLLTKDGAGKAWDPWKLGILGASTLPFFMGGQEDEDQDKAFDYEGAKNAYADEIMRLRRGVMAGSLKDATTQAFLPVNYRDGGRIGYQGGGMEDPMLVEEY